MKPSIKIHEKHPRILRYTHWINIPLLLIMAWSGILIYWADQAWIKLPQSFVKTFRIEYRLAEGMSWHFFIMWPFVINGFIYLLYLIFSKHWTRNNYNPIQKAAYICAMIMTTGLLLSGIAIYKPVQLGWLVAMFGGYEAARLVHFLLMLGMMVFVCLHIIQVFRSGWNNMRSMIAGFEIEKD